MKLRLPGARADRIIIVVALAILVAVGIATSTAGNGPPTPYADTSAASDGTLALFRWIAALGLQPRELNDGPLQPAGASAIFVLEPQAAFTSAEVNTTLRWVRAGGTLILLEDGGDTTLPTALGIAIHALPGGAGLSSLFTSYPYGAAPLQPLLAHPPLHGLSVSATSGVYADSPKVVPLLGLGGVRPPGSGSHTRVAPPDATNPLLVYEQMGRGRIYAGSIPTVVTNGQLARGENRLLIVNLLAGLPAGATVGFDAYHLTVAPSTPATLGEVLVTTGWGRALLYALVLIAAYIVLTGRRLGPPLRAIPERGRSLAEYVISMAATFRRAGLRERVLSLWQDDLRRALAGTAGVRGRADAELIGEAARRAGLSPQEESDALTLLRLRAALGEETLVELCRRIARLQERITGR